MPTPTRPLPLVATTAAAAVAFVGALLLLAAIAGWSKVGDYLQLHSPFWLAVAFAAELAAFCAYVLAYRAVAEVDGGRRLGWREATELVAVGFGPFFAKGGAALDSAALRGSDGNERDGEVRVLALDALEHAPLAPATCAAAISLLARNQRRPGLDFTIPWAVLVPVGAVLAFFGVRHRDRFVGADGWRGTLGDVLEGVAVLFRLAQQWRRHWLGFVGAAVYWAGDVLCLWGSLMLFGAAPQFAGIVVAHAVGYVLTRRTLPLAGAGTVEILMPLTLTAAGAPFAGAILAVFTYRLFNLWLPLLPALAALPSLRTRYGKSFQLRTSATQNA